MAFGGGLMGERRGTMLTPTLIAVASAVVTFAVVAVVLTQVMGVASPALAYGIAAGVAALDGLILLAVLTRGRERG
jgi:hypothetical protein